MVQESSTMRRKNALNFLQVRSNDTHIGVN